MYQKPLNPNRASRRANASYNKHAPQRTLESRARALQMDEADKRKEGLKKRIEASRARREKRDALRHKFAKIEGVNWKRIALLGKVGEGDKCKYAIRNKGAKATLRNANV